MVIETNIDDSSGEWQGYLMQQLLAAGALDVTFTPLYMKKNRPATQVQIIASLDKVNALSAIVFKESTSIGVRFYPVERFKCQRKKIKVHTTWGKVSVKLSYWDGQLVNVAPEFEDCKGIAMTHHIALKEVYRVVSDACARIERNSYDTE